MKYCTERTQQAKMGNVISVISHIYTQHGLLSGFVVCSTACTVSLLSLHVYKMHHQQPTLPLIWLKIAASATIGGVLLGVFADDIHHIVHTFCGNAITGAHLGKELSQKEIELLMRLALHHFGCSLLVVVLLFIVVIVVLLLLIVVIVVNDMIVV